MTMKNDTIPFDHLRKVLLDLGFVETAIPGPYWHFKHSPTETILVYRKYRPSDCITWADHVSTRKLLDERGLLEAGVLDTLLSKTPA